MKLWSITLLVGLSAFPTLGLAQSAPHVSEVIDAWMTADETGLDADYQVAIDLLERLLVAEPENHE
ncbi:MAG: hypothetical protein HN348_24175, partial [Proteobacteria bacterium]|nr:hypothetical protein [Pseudomonadota bacterium]